VIHPSSEPIADEDREKRMENCIASMEILTDEVKKYNAQLVVEDLPRSCLGNTSAEILRIVKATGNGLGVCFDTNHLLKEKPEEFAENVGGLIKTLHVSDYDGIDEKHWLPGTGIINWNNVIAALAESGYKGPFMYETSQKKPSSESQKERIRLTPKDLSENIKELKADLFR